METTGGDLIGQQKVYSVSGLKFPGKLAKQRKCIFGSSVSDGIAHVKDRKELYAVERSLRSAYQMEAGVAGCRIPLKLTLSGVTFAASFFKIMGYPFCNCRESHG